MAVRSATTSWRFPSRHSRCAAAAAATDRDHRAGWRLSAGPGSGVLEQPRTDRRAMGPGPALRATDGVWPGARNCMRMAAGGGRHPRLPRRLRVVPAAGRHPMIFRGVCRLPASGPALPHGHNARSAGQNAGSTAPLYLVSMNAFTCGLVRALASFCTRRRPCVGRATRKIHVRRVLALDRQRILGRVEACVQRVVG